ncbi:hypothetical protein R6Q59_002591 [Mikania micrantha]
MAATESDVPQTTVKDPETKTETDGPPSTVNVSETKTVEVGNVSMAVTEKDIWEFFSFSGNIHYIEMKSESETTQHAFVTFKESRGANTALLLTGATIGNLSVSLSPVENYQLPAGAPPLTTAETPSTNTDMALEVAQKAEEVVSTMLAKGYILGKDALQKAKSFDERHQITSNASATVASIDRKMGLTEKINTGTAVVNEKMKEVDERYQVSETTKSAITTAEQKASNAGSALMSNKYVSSGAVWIAGAFAAVTKAAEGIGSKTKEKVHEAEEGKEGSKTKEKVDKAVEEKEGPKTIEKVDKAVEEKEGSDTKVKVDKPEEEKEGFKTKEQIEKAEEEKEGSKTKEKVQEAEGSNKDSPIIPVKSSNENN